MALQPGRWTAALDGDFVGFLIGAMVHDPAVATEASGLLMAMTDMLDELDELEADPSQGLLGYTLHGEPGSGVLVQYWRSFEALEAYARNPGARHAPVWRAWNRLGSDDRGAAGIWHETFKVSAGDYEAIYQNTPVMGLQGAGRPITVTGAKDSARARLSRWVARRTQRDDVLSASGRIGSPAHVEPAGRARSAVRGANLRRRDTCAVAAA